MSTSRCFQASCVLWNKEHTWTRVKLRFQHFIYLPVHSNHPLNSLTEHKSLCSHKGQGPLEETAQRFFCLNLLSHAPRKNNVY